MHARQSSVVCESGHDFAISAKGFLNLIPHQKPLKGYDETFFASRQRIMDCTVDNVRAYLQGAPINVVNP